MPDQTQWSKETLAIAKGRPPRVPGSPINVPPVLATSFHAGGEHSYARDDGTPTWEALEDVLGSLEGGHATVFASGMAAVASVFANERYAALVVPDTCYAGVRPYARDYAAARSIECTLVDITDTASTLDAVTEGSLLWLESPTNPLLQIADLPALVDGAHTRGAAVAVDNTFATPLLQSPLALGADFSVHSASKYISGHSDVTLGIAIVADAARLPQIRHYREYSGAVPGALETYLALRGIRTLPVRLEKAQANARELVRELASHPAVECVRYPGFGAMISFDVRGGAAAADRTCAALRLIAHATSLGGVESSMERRQKYAGEAYLPPGLIRMSVGCENAADLWSDLRAALDAGAAP
jgi:cystathionine gamma-synthase